MQKENHLLQKRVNLFDGISIVAGAMIGSGIFIVSADIARNVGSPGWLLVVWLITGIITVIGAINYGELASMMPHVGGQYVYLKEAYHPLIGFLFGWTTFLVIQCGSIAAVAVAFAKFSGVLFPWISEKNILLQLGPLKINSTMVIAIAMISFLTWLNTRGIVTGKTVQNIFSSTKVIALFGFIAIGFLATKSILTILAIFVLRVKRPDIPRPYKAFGYPVIPAIYVITTITIMVILLIYKPGYTFPGLGIVLLGIPVFYLWKKYNKSPEKDQEVML